MRTAIKLVGCGGWFRKLRLKYSTCIYTARGDQDINLEFLDCDHTYGALALSHGTDGFQSDNFQPSFLAALCIHDCN